MEVKTGFVIDSITAIHSKGLNLYKNKLHHSLNVKQTPPRTSQNIFRAVGPWGEGRQGEPALSPPPHSRPTF